VFSKSNGKKFIKAADLEGKQYQDFIVDIIDQGCFKKINFNDHSKFLTLVASVSSGSIWNITDTSQSTVVKKTASTTKFHSTHKVPSLTVTPQFNIIGFVC